MILQADPRFPSVSRLSRLDKEEYSRQVLKFTATWPQG